MIILFDDTLIISISARIISQGVSDSYLENDSWSFTIGPGFYKADAGKPEHPRVPRKKFCEWVVAMNESNQPWQLIVSFNEWGEGTAVESAVEWKSESGYGVYLDCLHDPVKYGDHIYDTDKTK